MHVKTSRRTQVYFVHWVIWSALPVNSVLRTTKADSVMRCIPSTIQHCSSCWFPLLIGILLFLYLLRICRNSEALPVLHFRSIFCDPQPDPIQFNPIQSSKSFVSSIHAHLWIQLTRFAAMQTASPPNIHHYDLGLPEWSPRPRIFPTAEWRSHRLITARALFHSLQNLLVGNFLLGTFLRVLLRPNRCLCLDIGMFWVPPQGSPMLVRAHKNRLAPGAILSQSSLFSLSSSPLHSSASAVTIATRHRSSLASSQRSTMARFPSHQNRPVHATPTPYVNHAASV